MKEGISTVISWGRQLIDFLLVFIALSVLIEIVYGDSAWVFSGVVDNMMALVGEFGDGGVAGLFALLIIFALYNKHAA